MIWNDIHELFNGLVQAAGLDVSKVTLIALWTALFFLARILLGGSRAEDSVRRAMARHAGPWRDTPGHGANS